MLKFYTAGESHGQALLAFLSGLPAGTAHRSRIRSIANCIAASLAMAAAAARKSKKISADIFAGVRHGQTIGAPIALRIENRDWANWEKILASRSLS